MLFPHAHLEMSLSTSELFFLLLAQLFLNIYLNVLFCFLQEFAKWAKHNRYARISKSLSPNFFKPEHTRNFIFQPK